VINLYPGIESVTAEIAAPSNLAESQHLAEVHPHPGAGDKGFGERPAAFSTVPRAALVASEPGGGLHNFHR